MKIFTKRLALVTGLLFTALICCGIVFIDTTQNYWYVNGGFVKLIVSNQTQQAIMTVDTNTMRVGFNTNNTARSFVVKGRSPADITSGNATPATTTGIILLVGGTGGNTTDPTTAIGGTGGGVILNGGAGGTAAATTNTTGGTGGVITLTGGSGGLPGTVATNQATGGNGGSVTISSGAGVGPTAAATNTVGGDGGNLTISASGGSQPTAGWSRKAGNGGTFTLSTGNGANSTRTNGGNGGNIIGTAGNSGNAGTAPGDAGTPGNVSFTAGNSGTAVAGGNPNPGGTLNLTAGNGSTGDTNSDGGHVFIAGGAPGSGAVPGNVVLARTSAGASLGAGVQIGPLITGGSATITNVLGNSALLDFPSTVAGTFSELTIAVTGVTSNNVAVSLSVPWQSAQTGGAFVTFNSNDVIYVRFINNQLVTAIDPEPGVFSVVGFRIR